MKIVHIAAKENKLIAPLSYKITNLFCEKIGRSVIS